MQELVASTFTALKQAEYEQLKAEVTAQLTADFADRQRKHTPTFHKIIRYLKDSDATTAEEKQQAKLFFCCGMSDHLLVKCVLFRRSTSVSSIGVKLTSAKVITEANNCSSYCGGLHFFFHDRLTHANR